MMDDDFSRFVNRGLTQYLGIEFISATAAEVVATMPVTPNHHQPFGYLHGGASVVLAESVVSVGGSIAAGAGKACMGMEINANHLRPKRDGSVRAVGKPVHIGKNTQVWDVQIFDEAERLICVSRCTLAVVPMPKP